MLIYCVKFNNGYFLFIVNRKLKEIGTSPVLLCHFIKGIAIAAALLPFPPETFNVGRNFLFLKDVFKLGHKKPLDKTFKKTRLNSTVTHK